MKVTISGRDIELTLLTGTMDTEMLSGILDLIDVWRAEAACVVRKMSSTFARPERGYGATPGAAIANLFEKLDDAGEMEGQYEKCISCGKGRRILSAVTSYIPHDDKCPAIDKGNEG